MEAVFSALEQSRRVQDVSAVRKHSRNTVIAFASVEGKPAVLKFNPGLRGAAGIEAVRQQAEIVASFTGEDQHFVAGILAHWPEHGVIAVERCTYPSIAVHLIDRHSDPSQIGQAYGKALRFFHDQSALSQPDQQLALLHRDFSPANVLLDTQGADFCIIDIPDRKVLGRREQDVGVALFEIVRTVLKTKGARSLSVLLAVRKGFISGYYEGRVPLPFGEMLAINGQEYRHAFVVMSRYLRFWRYRDWPVQLLRMAAFFPTTLAMTLTIIPLVQLLSAGPRLARGD